MSYEAADYTVSVQRVKVDDETLFRAQVKEFPDVDVYEATAELAYRAAFSIIEDLISCAQEMGHEIPKPWIDSEEQYSGRVTLRMPKGLHQKIAAVADGEEVSLNHYITSVLATAAAMNKSYFHEPASSTRREIEAWTLLREDVYQHVEIGRKIFEVKIEAAEPVKQKRRDVTTLHTRTYGHETQGLGRTVRTFELGVDRPFGKAN